MRYPSAPPSLHRAAIAASVAALLVAGCLGGDEPGAPVPVVLTAFPGAGLLTLKYESAGFGSLVGIASFTAVGGGMQGRIVFQSKTNPRLGAGRIDGSFALNQEACFTGTETFAGKTGAMRLTACTLAGGKLTATVESTITANAAGADAPTAKALTAAGASPSATASAAGGGSMTASPAFTEDQFNALYRNHQTATQDGPVWVTGTDGQKYAPGSRNLFTYGSMVAAFQDLYTTWGTVNGAGTYAAIPVETLFGSDNAQDNLREIAALMANATQETNGATPPSAAAVSPVKGVVASIGTQGLPWGLTRPDECTGGIFTCVDYGDLKGYCTGTNVNGAKPQLMLDDSCASDSTTDYCRMAALACKPVKADPPTTVNSTDDYHGRGLLQLTGPDNYIFYGNYITPTKTTSLAVDPAQVASDGRLAWEVGLAYWSLPAAQAAGNTKPTPHQLMFAPSTSTLPIIARNGGANGFGQTINIINGGVECGSATTATRVLSLNRINAYIEALLRLGVNVNNVAVTIEGGDVHVYSAKQLADNIDSATSKAYTVGTLNGQTKSSDYTAAEPKWALPGGRYLSVPLLQEYYVSGSDYDAKPPLVPLWTNITKVVLTYADTTTERLDCTGYTNYSQAGAAQ